MLHLAWRMTAHRISALLAVAGAVLGGAVLITATGVLAESGLRAHLAPGRLGGADVVVAAGQEYHPAGDVPIALPERAVVPATFTRRLAGLPGVTAAVGDIGFPAAVIDRSGRVLPVAEGDPRADGHGWSSTRLLAHPRIEGRAPSGPGEVAVDAGTGLRLGDRVRLAAAGRAAAPYRVTALVRAPGAGIYVADTAAVRLAGRGPSGGPRAGTVDLVGLTAAPGQGPRVADEARHLLAGTGLKVTTGGGRGAAAAPGEDAGRSLLVLLSGSLGGIVLLITGFVTAGALGVSIAGQRRDLALMRAVGATPQQIRRLARGQSLRVAAAAVAPGIGIGYLLAGRFRSLLVGRGVLPAHLPLALSPFPALATIALVAATVWTAAGCAAWRTSRMPATEAVADSHSEPRQSSPGRTGIGLLLIAAACVLSTAPLLQRSLVSASATSIAGILAAIGLASAGPALVRRAGEAAVRNLRPGASAPTWLAAANVRAYAHRVTGVVAPLAMAVVFVLTYTLAQTTVMAATSEEARAGTLAGQQLTAPALGGLPDGTAAAVRALPGVRAAAPTATTTALWTYRQFGDPTTESESAMVLTPRAAGVLDLGVRQGSLSALTGATVAVSSDAAGSRGAGLGHYVRLTLGDGTPVRARVVAVYGRGLGFGPLVLSRDLAAGHTTAGLDQSVLVRTDGSAAARQRLAGYAAARPGLVLTATAGDGNGAGTPPEAWVNLAVVVVMLGYLLLSIANRLVAATAQRRSEIAALRLAGTTPRQVLSMMRREAAMVAGAAIAAGLALSALPLALLGQGFLGRPWPAGPVWLLPAAAVTVAVTAFATIEMPTRQALRTPPAEAMRARS
ncbi:ABC transporter permease [Actinacidiphila guanduensis]|uniref:Putative ABC transport system permease protein n=1 Tax=Actinacidiphila guanduensis TaxID=310781 RepID=A0A1H0P9I0_9ACTN|nr:ABC transporter permease [Actinacidiphila guanduensis]SDP01410.1 putative ABC transport system permease protein [Actinacidiphila guanduensis]